MKIGLCLSGGGVRATAFHLGVLDRLATAGRLEQIHCLSTVSGGSLLAGLVFTLSKQRWPDSAAYRAEILPRARELLTGHDLQNAYLRRCLVPWLLVRGRALALARALEALWDITAELRDLPERPRWLINATTYETGKNWRFERGKMGDWKTNYVLNPRFPVSEAIGASAAVPGFIGPIVLRGADYEWHRRNWKTMEWIPEPKYLKRISLWDGGVYENLGVEALFKPNKPGRVYRQGIDFLLLSDASAPPTGNPPRYKAPYRLVELAMDQVRSLRERMIVAHFDAHPETGSLLKMGNTASYIFENSGATPPDHWDPDAALPKETVMSIRKYRTDLHRLSAEDFRCLFLHGYEVADITLTAYCGSMFGHVPYAPPAAVGEAQVAA